MKKLFLLAVFILTSCAPQITVAPTATVTLLPTATQTPAPTATPTSPPITIYTPDQLAKVDVAMLIKNAPEIDGYTKYTSPAGKHIVLYKNSENKVEKAYNWLTGETLEDLVNISTNPEKPTPITYEDLTSGRLADSERLQCPAFSKNAIPGDWFQSTQPGYFTTVQIRTDEVYTSNPKTRPEKICSFSELNIDLGVGVKPYTLIGFEVLNADKSMGFFHGFGRPNDILRMLEAYENKSLSLTTDELMRDSGYPEKQTISSMYPDGVVVGRVLDATDILPQEFEKRIFTVGAVDW